MSIEIYDKAEVVQKDDTFYYLIKYGSKNCFTCRYQLVIDNKFNNKFLKRETRDSFWTVIATGGIEEYKNKAIANTIWNCPTSEAYGKVKFGNKNNMALYFAKSRPFCYELLDPTKRCNISKILSQSGKVIDLKNIDTNKSVKSKVNYCDKEFLLDDNFVLYDGKKYWNLDNL